MWSELVNMFVVYGLENTLKHLASPLNRTGPKRAFLQKILTG